MSFPIVVDAERRRAAQAFADLLSRTMKARGVGRKVVAASLHMRSHSIIAAWRSGNTLPSLESATRLADCLGEPKLAELVRKARTHLCERPGCGNSYLYEGGGPSRFCSPSCGKLEAKRQRFGPPAKVRATEAEAAAAMSREAVDAFCRGCEPEGYCRTATCALRLVSPLPLSTDPRPEPAWAEPAPGPYGTPENREKTVAATRAALARRWADPEERRRQSERTAAMHVSRRDAASRLEEIAQTIVNAGGAATPNIDGADLVELAQYALGQLRRAGKRLRRDGVGEQQSTHVG